MTRREEREAIFKTIFQLPFYSEAEELPEIDIEDYKPSEKNSDYINAKVENIKEKLPVIDEYIQKNSRGWKLNRIGKAELAILRVGVYELIFDDDIPDAVAVNEAVELSKKFCNDKSSAFINGVLANIMNQK